MNSIHIISQDVFDKIRSRFSNLEMGDETGAVTSDPKKARFFDFDFVLENENLGRVSISINEIGSLKIFYSQGILEDTESYVKTLWYDFLREMRMFAKRRLLRFDTRDITKSHLDKNDFQYLASTGQKDEITMQESKMFGSSKSSYLPLEKTKLIVRHNKPVDETQIGARSRRHNIKALYIENQDGERFKYPFEHLAGAKAMQRHVANGGRPYDNVGKKIIEMSQHIAELTAFKRHVQGHDKMNYEINEITEKADSKLQNLKQTMENLCRQGFYESWKESVQPFNDDEQMVLDQATMEDYKSKFTVKSFKEDLTQFFPLIHKIMQEAGTIDLESYQEDTDSKDDELTVEYTKTPFEDFENWADRIVEGRIEPDTLVSLKDLVEAGLTLGADGLSAIEALEGIGIHDEKLEKALVELAKVNPEADPVPTIKAWLTKEDPEAAEELGMKADEGNVLTPDDEEEMGEPIDMDFDNDGKPSQTPSSVINNPENESFEKEPNIREIAEMVKSFYDRETGKFPKGKTGVVVHVKKELGEKAGLLAEKLVDKLEAETMNQDQQVNEIAPLLAAGARALLPMLAKAGSRIGPAIGNMAKRAGGAAADVAGKTATGVGRGAVELGKSTAQSAAQNAGKIGIGMGAYTALTDLADKFAGGVGEIYNDAKTLATDIGSIVGNGINKDTIASLSEWAVKNAIPIGIIIALLYGGWKLLGNIIREDEELQEMDRIQQLAGLKKIE